MARESRSVWTARVTRLRKSGLDEAGFAAQEGVKVRTLQNWKWRLEREARGSARPTGRRPRSATFVEVTSGASASVFEIDVGGAVVRNGIRRRLREWVRKEWDRVPKGMDVVIIAQPGCAKLNLEELSRILLRSFARLARSS